MFMITMREKGFAPEGPGGADRGTTGDRSEQRRRKGDGGERERSKQVLLIYSGSNEKTE